MFHVVRTAPPLVALESCTVPLSFTWVTMYGPLNLAPESLRCGSSFDHDLVSYVVGVRNVLGVLLLVVLEDTMLLSFLDVVPISLERDV
jgi:hypothetical protein